MTVSAMLSPLLRHAPALLLTTLAYCLAGQVALWLALPPSFASPLYPAAGIALAAVLLRGPAMLPAVMLGALIVNGWLAVPRDLPLPQGLLTAGVIALGAAGQAALGAWLVRRAASAPLALDSPREAMALSILGGMVACLLSASLATFGLWAVHALPASAALSTWLTWWAGDALGVMVATPLALTLFGEPRSLWASRRLTVGLPLLLVSAVLTLAMLLVAQGVERRRVDRFERDADQMAEQIRAGLREHLNALEAMRGLFMASEQVSQQEVAVASAHWLREESGLQAVGFSQFVLRDDVPAFEARVRESGMTNFRVFDRPGADLQLSRNDPARVVIRHIQPTPGNASALGVNALSIPAARVAIQAALRSDRPQATAGFRLTQSASDQTGIVVYRAVFPGGQAPGDSAALGVQPLGVVFVTLQMERSLQALTARQPDYLRWCLLDRSPGATRPRLAGPPACDEPEAGAWQLLRPLSFAGRDWALKVAARPTALPGDDRWTPWFFSLAGLLSVALLNTLLLSITGRARRVELAVEERTADLRREVHERQRTGLALRDSEQRLRNILDHVPLGVMYADLGGAIREANPRMRELLGLGRQDVLPPKGFAQLLHSEDRAHLDAWVEQLRLDPGSTVYRQVRLLQRTGLPLWTQMGLSALLDAAGQPQRLVAVFEDISERLKLADAERARESAEAASRAKSDFLSRMSHELRTPLNAILGFTQLLALDRQPALSSRQAERAAQVQRAGWHLLHMIDDMLDLSRIEAGQLQLNIEAVPLAALISDSLDLVEQSAADRQVQLVNECLDSPLAAWADRTRAKQVLTNLFSNGVKYNRPGGRLQVRLLSAPGGRVEVQVQDDGIGMTAEQLRGLFRPFSRLGRERSGIEGTGLGLVISRRLTELMSGSLLVESEPEVGTVFVLSLPAATPQDSLRGEDDTLTLPPRSDRTRRVVYIEDNETNAEVMRGVLARRPQVALQVCSTGAQGLRAIQEDPPCLVLLDMQLPDMDGLAILRELRAAPATQDLPVMVVSADATTVRVEQAFEEGATDYVTKPVEITAFLSQFDQLLDRQDSRFGL
jgi:PAS domain S-box-containing protein